ncbi:MAG: AAA family ATPase [Candidatus Jordarchaeaceae archaeon]
MCKTKKSYLNILIGPNNCGKTNLLKLLNLLSSLYTGRAYGYLCPHCNYSIKNKGIDGIGILLAKDDFYLKSDPNRLKIRVRILLNENSIEKFIPNI